MMMSGIIESLETNNDVSKDMGIFVIIVVSILEAPRSAAFPYYSHGKAESNS